MGDVSSEPTMEEILSSIKRVIEESETAPTAARPRRPARTAAGRDIEEVLELSERMPFPAVNPAVPHDDDASEAVDDAPVPPPSMLTPPAKLQPQPQTQPTPAPRAESILSPNTAEASRGPLEALSRLIVKPETAGGDTLEGMVREMLRPMLREWLDAQLPQIVETMVAREIARISDRGA